MYYQFPMTKYFCDICLIELFGEYASVEIMMEKYKYHHKIYCLSCFYAKKSHNAIHVKPEPYQKRKLPAITLH